MEVEQVRYETKKGWQDIWKSSISRDKFQLVLGFGSPEQIKSSSNFDYLKSKYPNAHIILASTGGEIMDEEVFDNSLCASALYFEKTPLVIHSVDVMDINDTLDACKELSIDIEKKDLRHILVLGNGLQINGSDIIEGLKDTLSDEVSITGGLAGDGYDLGRTFTGYNAPAGDVPQVIAICFYGESIKIGSGSIGGWDNFGVRRRVTKSKGPVVYTLDDKPILDLYKLYLGDRAKDLPGSGILFPMNIYKDKDDEPVIRTLLAVDEKDKSVLFAGDVPEGYTARLMKANFERLIDGAIVAADKAQLSLGEFEDIDFALLISCVGRRIALKQRTEEEVEGVRSLLGPGPKFGGFYSHGEIGPSQQFVCDCKFHNQTMTITLFNES